MRVFVTVTLKSGARIVAEMREESTQEAARKLKASLSEPHLHLTSNDDYILIASDEVAAFQLSPNKP